MHWGSCEGGGRDGNRIRSGGFAAVSDALQDATEAAGAASVARCYFTCTRRVYE
jgi:hypothetical protein